MRGIYVIYAVYVILRAQGIVVILPEKCRQLAMVGCARSGLFFVLRIEEIQ